MENKNLRDWAERYLDLWEDQVSAAASDHAMAAALGAPVLPAGLPAAAGKTCLDGEQWQDSFEAWLSAFQQAISASAGTAAANVASDPAADGSSLHDPSSEQREDTPDAKHRGGSDDSCGSASGAEASCLSSGDGGGDLDDIARRLAGLAADISALAAGAKGSGGDTS